MRTPALLLAIILPLVAAAAPLAPVERSLVIDSSAPSVKMLIPGFTVRELPLSLHNINSLVCAPDGRLFALCYDGNVLQLKATNGDGLEDAVTYYYRNDDERIPASIGMAWGPGGLYIASQGEIFRLRDKGATGELETIAKGWHRPSRSAGSSLDAVGMAVDPAGNVYFGIGADDWSNPYCTNRMGKSLYDVTSVRGTVQKLSPDFKHMETIATGLRYTVCLAFNSAGDLFATDQEGATWLANGNPFDELLQIVPGRHYGFPPRHPDFLPNVIDEPSVFDYSPQHQSACGVHFNDPVAGSTNIFGPEWWRGDAFVTGESRGKLWRTKLVKTPAGYVAQNQLIACFKMMPIDAIPMPNGDLLVTCHSGRPDWGSGPRGIGHLYRISYTDRSAPLPVLSAAGSSSEFDVFFDRPLDASHLANASQASSMEMGKYVVAGNRYEEYHPGYKAVQDQMRVPRYGLPALSAALGGAKQTLMALRTIPSVQAVNYGLTLPSPVAGDSNKVDTASDLSGVECEYRDAGGKEAWSGWLPDFDLTVDRALTAASPEHRRLFDALASGGGSLVLRGQLNLWSMLHPAIQPGEKLSFSYPPEHVTVYFSGDRHFKLAAPDWLNYSGESDGFRTTVTPTENQWTSIEIEIPTGGVAPELSLTWFTDEDPRPRAMPLWRVMVPWAKPATQAPVSASASQIPEIAGGDWEGGKKLFYSETPGCFKCHQVAGEGGRIGPDLSNLIYRDYASVMRDIVEPSAAINPDHLAYNVSLTDGGEETGVILTNGADEIVLGQVTGKSLTVPRSKIARIQPSAVSLMPEGLLKNLSDQQQRDLLTFLLTAPPR